MTIKKKGKEIKMANVNDALFNTACDIAGVTATARQYRKWKRGDGSARAKQLEAQSKLEESTNP